MPDLLLFVLGVFVTAIVGLAVWSVGQLDVDGSDGPDLEGKRSSERSRPLNASVEAESSGITMTPDRAV